MKKKVFSVLGLLGFLLIFGGVGESEIAVSEAGFYYGIIVALVGFAVIGAVILGNCLHNYFSQDRPL